MIHVVFSPRTARLACVPDFIIMYWQVSSLCSWCSAHRFACQAAKKSPKILFYWEVGKGACQVLPCLWLGELHRNWESGIFEGIPCYKSEAIESICWILFLSAAHLIYLMFTGIAWGAIWPERKVQIRNKQIDSFWVATGPTGSWHGRTGLLGSAGFQSQHKNIPGRWRGANLESSCEVM